MHSEEITPIYRDYINWSTNRSGEPVATLKPGRRGAAEQDWALMRHIAHTLKQDYPWLEDRAAGGLGLLCEPTEEAVKGRDGEVELTVTGSTHLARRFYHEVLGVEPVKPKVEWVNAFERPATSFAMRSADKGTITER